MPGAHAKWSPSGSPFWYNNGDGCPARVLLDPKPETSSPAAEEGTRLHDVAEQYLAANTEPATADREVLAEYLDYVEDKSLDPSVTVSIEVEADLLPVTGESATGTIDALVYSDDFMEVIDLKTGQKRVQPSSNQLAIYAASVVYEMDYQGEYVLCTIHQGGEAISYEWETEQLIAFSHQVRDYVDREEEHARVTGAPRFNPTESNCQWCPHVVDCPAHQAYRDQVAAMDFKVEALAEEDLGEHLTMVGALKRWCAEVEKRALELAEKGGKVSGFKLVHARANRKWKPDAEEKIVALLGDAAYDKKLIGLTAADKLVDAETMNDLTTKPEGKPTLAPEDDPRPEINDAATDFKDA